MKKASLFAAAALAMMAPTAMTNAIPPVTRQYIRARPKNPTMAIDKTAIIEWNRNVKTRQVVRRLTRPWNRRTVGGGVA